MCNKSDCVFNMYMYNMYLFMYFSLLGFFFTKLIFIFSAAQRQVF